MSLLRAYFPSCCCRCTQCLERTGRHHHHRHLHLVDTQYAAAQTPPLPTSSQPGTLLVGWSTRPSLTRSKFALGQLSLTIPSWIGAPSTCVDMHKTDTTRPSLKRCKFVLSRRTNLYKSPSRTMLLLPSFSSESNVSMHEYTCFDLFM